MQGLDALLQGFAVALTLPHLLLMVAGILLGLLVGVLPGLGAPNGVAILLPVTFAMEPVSAIILLTCIYWGALFGGSVTAILFNIPGEPSSIATTFDGYPMARDGEAGRALTAAFSAAFIGALIGILVLTLAAPALSRFALRFGPPEFFAVFALAFCSFIGTAQGHPARVVISLMLGFSFTQVGMDAVTGSYRLTFDWHPLRSGVSFLIAVIGLFGVGEILEALERQLTVPRGMARLDPRVMGRTLKELPQHAGTFARSAAIGCWMGITPGGPTAASLMSYAIARRLSRQPQRFGKGAMEGIVAPETADHAAGTAALLPMLSLGIPGSATAAVLLGGLMMWGLQPGPMLFIEHRDFVWSTIASMYLGNVIGLILVMATIPLFAAVLRIRFAIIGPLILAICIVGAWTVAGSLRDVWLMLGFGVLGWVMRKLDYPLAPLILAMVLGDRAEEAFRQAMLMSGGSLSIFWANGLVATLMGLALLLLLLPVLRRPLPFLVRSRQPEPTP